MYAIRSYYDIAAVGYDPRGHRRFLMDYFTGEFPESLACGKPFGRNRITSYNVCYTKLLRNRAFAYGKFMLLYQLPMALGAGIVLILCRHFILGFYNISTTAYNNAS